MKVEIDRCPECGGGPVSGLKWERTARGIVTTKTRCDNCGHVAELPSNERRVVETV